MAGSTRKVASISVAMTKEQRAEFEAEARLGRVDRARRWQTERLSDLADRIEAGEFIEASKADIDAAFRV